jgi:hypothetical protein
MTLPRTWKDKTSPVIPSVRSPFTEKYRSYHASSRTEGMRARRTFLGYQKGCRLKEAVVDLEGTGVPVSVESRE